MLGTAGCLANAEHPPKPPLCERLFPLGAHLFQTRPSGRQVADRLVAALTAIGCRSPAVRRATNRVAVAPAVRDLFERFDFHTQIERLDKANPLYLVAEKFATIDPHPDVVSNEKLGTVFEELIRRFVKLSNATAAEHVTSRKVIRLRVNLMFIEDDGCSARSSTRIRTPSARRTCSFGVERKKIEKEVRREHEQQGFNGRFGLVLPTDLFHNTGIARCVWVVINKKPAARQRLVQLIDASGKDLTRWSTRTNGQLFLRVGRWRNWQSCLV